MEVEISKAIAQEQLKAIKLEVAVEAQKKAAVEVDEEKKRNRELAEQVTQLLKQMRELKRHDEERELEMAKKMAEEEGEIRNEAKKKAIEETDLKMAEKDKKITDMEKMIEELKKTAQQGSQQTQGEVLELQLEQLLRREFPNDTVAEVPKGIRGADVIQEVRDRTGRSCGTVLWESKNAKWTSLWIAKLKDDQRAVKADVAILLSVDLPKEMLPFSYQNGVWVTNRDSLVPLAGLLRITLHDIFVTKQGNVDKKEKMEFLYSYFTGIEFKQKVEAIVEAFSALHEDIEREKRWFSVKWARQEKYTRKALDQALGMYGDVQGITGQSLPEIKSLEEPQIGRDDKID